MKAYALKMAFAVAVLALVVGTTHALANGEPQSNGRHLAKGHYKSGIIGQSVLSYGGFCAQFGNPPIPCPDSVPYATTVLVYSDKGELVATTPTDEEGYFEVFLKPGTYHLTASTTPPMGPSVGNVVSMTTVVTVQNKDFAPAYVFSAFHFF